MVIFLLKMVMFLLKMVIYPARKCWMFHDVPVRFLLTRPGKHWTCHPISGIDPSPGAGKAFQASH
jgi:hypothetical protein